MNANVISSCPSGWLRLGRVLIALVAFIALLTVVANASESQTPPSNAAKAGGKAVAGETVATVPLIHRALTNLNDAVTHLDAGQVELARTELAKAERLLGAVRHLLAEPEDRLEHRSAVPSPFRTPSHPVAPSSPFTLGQEESWNPWSAFPSEDDFENEFRDVHAQIQQLFRELPGSARHSPGWSDLSFTPATDIDDDGNAYVIRFDVPGADKANVDVKVEGRVLTVSGKTESVNEEKDKDRVIRSERRSGQFQRVITLPGPVKSDKVEAKCEKGVLTVTIPKAETDTTTKNIPVI